MYLLCRLHRSRSLPRVKSRGQSDTWHEPAESYRPITGIDDLRRMLTEQRIGAKTQMTVIRGPDKLTMEVVPGESPQSA